MYEQIISLDNLRLAYHNAKKGKKHYREVRQIELDSEDYLRQLHNMLAGDGFVNSPYEVFDLKTSGKMRTIYKLPFYPDRVVHHAIVQVLQPIWMRLFIRDTYSTIPGRGIHDGLRRVKAALKNVEDTRYCLKLDVRKYYPSVDHDILKVLLARKIKDARLMQLLEEIIDSAPGLPIGNYISQWFGNVYLAYFDHFVKEELGCKCYFRYADDLVFLGPDKERLWGVYGAVKSYLNNQLNLEIKGNWQLFPVAIRGIDFLGYRFYHTHTLVRKSIVQNFKRKIKGHRADIHTESSYWGWFKHADTHNLITKYYEREQTKKTG